MKVPPGDVSQLYGGCSGLCHFTRLVCFTLESSVKSNAGRKRGLVHQKAANETPMVDGCSSQNTKVERRPLVSPNDCGPVSEVGGQNAAGAPVNEYRCWHTGMDISSVGAGATSTRPDYEFCMGVCMETGCIKDLTYV